MVASPQPKLSNEEGGIKRASSNRALSFSVSIGDLGG
jgi:hypothetical protein